MSDRLGAAVRAPRPGRPMQLSMLPRTGAGRDRHGHADSARSRAGPHPLVAGAGPVGPALDTGVTTGVTTGVDGIAEPFAASVARSPA